MKKCLYLLIALFALGQTAWAQQEFNVSSEQELHNYLSNWQYSSCTFNLTNNITLTGDAFEVNFPVTINLGNYFIHGDDGSRIFYVHESGDLTLTGAGYLTHGADDNGAIIYNAGTLTIGGGLTLNLGNATNGGAIYNAGTLTLNGGNITRCKATNGGAIYNTGELTINAGVIGIEPYPNTATNNGGAIYNAGGTININDGNIEYCTATTNGGGIHSDGGTIVMTGGSISHNSATGNCGGVNLTNGTTMTMSYGSIDNNHSDANDGGVYIGSGSSLTMNSGSISGNTANYNAGVRVAGTMTMSGGSIANNTATNSSGGVHINSESTLSMTGGSITNNTAPSYAGIRVNGTLNMSGGSVTSNTATTNYGGIRVEGTLRMSGSPIVIGNTVGDNSNNVCLPNNKNITVNGAFAMGALIGVTHDNTLATFTSGFKANNPNPEMVFISDNETCKVVINGNEAALVGISAPGAFNGKYIDENGTEHTCSNYTLMSYFIINNITPNLSSGWYVVDQNLTFNDRITITGNNVNLILMDNTTLTANNGIYVPNSRILHIWGQSDKSESVDDFMGRIVAKAKDNDYSGIGGQGRGADAGFLYFHSGYACGLGGKNAAGIRGYPCVGEGNYSIFIYGGIVSGAGGENGAGIGGNFWSICSGILITGGRVIGGGGMYGAGIGSGFCGTMHAREGDLSGNPASAERTEIRITGGVVVATGGFGAGIGGGVLHDTYEGNAARVYIEGGTVDAETRDNMIAGWGYSGAQAIGHGGTFKTFYATETSTPEISDVFKVSATSEKDGTPSLVTRSTWNDDWVTYKRVIIEPCDHPYGTSYSDNGNSLNVGCNHCYTKEPYTFKTAGSWNNASNWLGSIMPGAGKNVAVKAAATIPASCTANVGNIDMQEGGSLTIADGGQLLHTNAVAGTIQKNIAGYGATTNPGGWYLLGAPILIDSALAVNSGMVDFTNGNIDFNTHGIDLYDFDQSQDLEWENMRTGNRFHFMGLNVNHAYLYARANDATLNFSTTDDHLFAPTSNDSLITVLRVINGASLAGYNLLSNPFTCNAYLASGRDFWRMNATGDAIVLATERAIKPCEGIFVMVAAQNDPDPFISGSIVVPNAAQIRFTTTEPEPAGGAKGLLDITVSHNSQLADVARVRFGDGDRTSKLVLDETATRLSIMQDGKDYSVVFAGTDVARNVSTTNEVPVNFKAKADGTYTISVNPEGVEMAYLHLIDNLTGADVDLLVPEPVEGPASYTFQAKTTDYPSRFKLVFSANDADGPSTGSGSFAFISDGNIIVNGEGVLQIIDVMGHVIRCTDVARNVSTAGITPGVYVLRLINGDDVKTQKIVIR